LKLGDFGISTHGPRTRALADAFNRRFVDVSVRKGKHRYWDARQDLWQVAQILAMLLTGKAEPVKLADVRTIPCSPATQLVIARALSERSQRFDSARAMSEALKRRAKIRYDRPRSLEGRHLVFTGEISIRRNDAIKLAEAAGGVVARDFAAKTTDMLVVGASTRWVGLTGGTKLLEALVAREAGRRVDLITEKWFLRLVGMG